MITRLIEKLKTLRLYFVISSNRKIKIDSDTGIIKLPKRKMKIPTDYYL